jgi:hypothetical protein
MRCGKCIEAFPEYAREQLLAIWNNPLPGQMEKEVILQVEGSHRAYDSEGPNQFRPRHVTGRKIGGLEVDFQVAFVPSDVFEAKVNRQVKDIPEIKAVTIPGGPLGASISGVVCLIDQIPTDVFYHKARWYWRSESVLSEEYLRPEDQLREGQGMATMSWLNRKLDAEQDPGMKYDKAKGNTPTWPKLMELVEAAKLSAVAKDTAVNNLMMSLNPSMTSSATGHITEVSSGSRFETFQVQRSGLGSALTIAPQPAGGSSAAPKRKVAAGGIPKSATAADRPVKVRRLKQEPQTSPVKSERGESCGSPVSVKFGMGAASSGTASPAGSGLKTEIPEAAGAASADTLGQTHYKHKDLDILDILKTGRNPGQQTGPASCSVCFPNTLCIDQAPEMWPPWSVLFLWRQYAGSSSRIPFHNVPPNQFVSKVSHSRFVHIFVSKSSQLWRPRNALFVGVVASVGNLSGMQ